MAGPLRHLIEGTKRRFAEDETPGGASLAESMRDLSALEPTRTRRRLEQKASCTGSLKSAIRRDQTTIRKNRSVTFVGRLSPVAGDKNDTRGATTMRYALVALKEG